MSSQREKELKRFCLEHSVDVSLDLLDTALTHKSFSHEQEQEQRLHNERLEFLGDAVVGLVVAEYLYLLLSESPEGELASLRAGVVSATTLARRARDLGLGQLLLLGKGEEKSGGRERESLLANAFEAVVAAIYLSRGLGEAADFILDELKPEVHGIIKGDIILDPKSALQEVLQQLAPEVPQYDVLQEVGPDHAKEFHVAVRWQNKVLGQGKGRSKKLAQQEAAREALELVKASEDKR